MQFDGQRQKKERTHRQDAKSAKSAKSAKNNIDKENEQPNHEDRMNQFVSRIAAGDAEKTTKN